MLDPPMKTGRWYSPPLLERRSGLTALGAGAYVLFSFTWAPLSMVLCRQKLLHEYLSGKCETIESRQTLAQIPLIPAPTPK